MLLRSGRALAGPSRSVRGSCSSAGRLRPGPLKRKSSGDGDGDGDGEPAQYRKAKSKSPPMSLLHVPEVIDTGDASDSELTTAFWWDNGDASDAELGAKLFPDQPPKAAIAMWNRFVANAKLCNDHYNKEKQADFLYKHSRDNGFFRITERDCKTYYHLNFYAQDKSGHSQHFFAEIEAVTDPKVENVTCCSPVSSSDAGGRSIRTIEEALKHVYPDWETAGMDYEHCYACIPTFKHPKGSCYVGGHFADTRQYYGF